MNPGINAARNGQHPIGLPELELHANRLGKDHSLEGLDRHLVSVTIRWRLPARSPLMSTLCERSIERMPPQHEAPPTRRGRHGLVPF